MLTMSRPRVLFTYFAFAKALEAYRQLIGTQRLCGGLFCGRFGTATAAGAYAGGCDNVLYVKSCDLKLRTLISFFVHFHAYPFLLVLNHVRAGLDSHGAAGALITCTNGVGTIVALCRGDLSNACRD